MSDISTTAKVTLLVNGEQARKIISDINTKLVAAEEVIRLSNQNADPRLENIPIYPNKACPYHLTVVLQHPPYHLTIHPASGNFHFSFFNYHPPYPSNFKIRHL